MKSSNVAIVLPAAVSMVLPCDARSVTHAKAVTHAPSLIPTDPGVSPWKTTAVGSAASLCPKLPGVRGGKVSDSRLPVCEPGLREPAMQPFPRSEGTIVKPFVYGVNHQIRGIQHYPPGILRPPDTRRTPAQSATTSKEASSSTKPSLASDSQASAATWLTWTASPELDSLM